METQVSYILQRKHVKNINLRIRPDGTIYISAPPSVPISSIEHYIESKKEFITKAVARFKEKRKWSGSRDGRMELKVSSFSIWRS